MKFDVVVGNPPYNEGRKVLWAAFANKSLDSSNKYVVFLHPCRWRGPGVCSPKNIGEFRDRVKQNDLLWISIHDIPSANKHFGASIRFDMYVLRKSNTPGLKTQIVGEDGVEYELDCKDREFIPNAQCPILDKIIWKE